jgi:hypothetical protein
VGYQIDIMSLELVKFGISRGEKSNEEVEKGLKIRIAGLLQGFVAREILTKLWFSHNKGAGLGEDRKSSGRQNDAT